MSKLRKSLAFACFILTASSVNAATPKAMTDEQATKLVEHSVQYVAMYNVNNKFALDENSPVSTGGWNKIFKATTLFDHNVQSIARPNNDTLYISAMLDLRDEAMILEIPAFDSTYASLMVTGYDHYVNVPMSNLQGDFVEATKVMFYSARTKNVPTKLPVGVSRKFEVTGDFISAVLRIMPHANEPERMAKIITAMKRTNVVSISEFMGHKAKTTALSQPDFGETDIATYQNNFAEVMQFVVNHTTFDPEFSDDVATLKVLAEVGIVPGQSMPATGQYKINSDQLAQAATTFYQGEVTKFTEASPEFVGRVFPVLFQPKGKTTMDAVRLGSVVGPIGLPIQEAYYQPLVTADGKPFNAMHDYVIRMTKDELPPAHAFWSITLYDELHGFFIPNEQKKYSVGENAGYELNAEGGIEIYVSVEKPEGVPAANWLPINRLDKDINAMARLYNPILDKLGAWETPKIVLAK